MPCSRDFHVILPKSIYELHLPNTGKSYTQAKGKNALKEGPVVSESSKCLLGMND